MRITLQERSRAIMSGLYFKLARLVAELDGYDEGDAEQLALIREADALDALDQDTRHAAEVRGREGR